jgi:hypothetical protein
MQSNIPVSIITFAFSEDSQDFQVHVEVSNDQDVLRQIERQRILRGAGV